MMEGMHSTANRQEPSRVLEARYSYYRRCQVFRRNGEQCRAPAEKGDAICHAHAAQQAMALRREQERRAVLAEAVAEMRRRGRPECEMGDLFTDFNGIQVTLATVSRALIHGRIDCKTAGRLLVGLQTASKLLWMVHKKSTMEAQRHGEEQDLPQICAESRRSDKSQEPRLVVAQRAFTSAIKRHIDGEDLLIAFKANVSMFPASHRGCRDGPWQLARAV